MARPSPSWRPCTVADCSFRLLWPNLTMRLKQRFPAKLTAELIVTRIIN
uniref:Uncharacterized protein n=1 Tax=Arundo donax TaxID=35708 RepID=A0A0A8YTM9_ARUDO